MFRHNIEKAGAHRYRVRKEHGGKVYKVTLRTRENAEAWLAQLEARLYGLNTRRPAPTIQEAADVYQATLRRLNRSPVTVEYYAAKYHAIRQTLGDLPLDQITQEYVNTYVERRLAVRVSAGTVNKELAALRVLYKLAELTPAWKCATLTHNPAERLVRSPEEVGRVWVCLSPQAQAAVALALLAGMRASEVYRADAEWLRRDQREIWIPVRKRRDPMKTALVFTLSELLKDVNSGPLVTVRKGVVDYELQSACATCRLSPPYRGPGAFRHHCATWGVEYGGGQFTVADARMVLGHHQAGATARYVHSQQVERKRQFLEVVERIFLVALDKCKS